VAMQRAVTIWNMIDARDVAGLGHFIRWQDAEKVDHGGLKGEKMEGWTYDSNPELPRFGSGAEAREIIPPTGRHWQYITPVLDLFKRDNVLTPASFMVQRWINEHLK